MIRYWIPILRYPRAVLDARPPAPDVEPEETTDGDPDSEQEN